MKIMILNGSPKRSASDTMHMTHAFVEGLNETVENVVHTVHVIPALFHRAFWDTMQSRWTIRFM